MKQILLERWQIHIGEDPLKYKLLVNNDEGGMRNKPKPSTALWLSSWEPKYGCSWNYFCETDYTGFKEGRGIWKCILAEDTTIIYIDGWEDFMNLWERYLLTTYMKTDWRKEYPQFTLDFELMREDGFDGINLSETGQWRTRFVPEGDGGMFSQLTLYGWDTECTLLFVNKIIHTAPIVLPDCSFDQDDEDYVDEEEGKAIHVAKCDIAYKENPYR